MERSEGGNFVLIPEGEALFEVFDISAKVPTAKSHYRKWKFNTFYDGEVRQIWQNVMAWDELPLLMVMGYEPDSKGGVDWDISDIVGHKRVRGTVWHEPYEGKPYAKIKDFKPASADDQEIPF
jgi:hypothetical protein